MSLMDNVTGILKENPVGTAIGAGIVGAGVGIGVASLVGSSSKKKTRKSRKKIVHTKRGRKLDRAKKSKQPWEVAYRRRKARKARRAKHPRRSRGGIKYTKKGQPYKIMSDGKARFIKKTKGRRR